MTAEMRVESTLSGTNHLAGNPRLQAVNVIEKVLRRGRSLPDALDTIRLEGDKRALVQELCFGVLRWSLRLEALAARLLDRPLRSKDFDVHCLLLVGLYQLLYMRIPDYAAINETVGVVRHLRKTWATGLVNAVLREAARSKEHHSRSVDRDPAARYAHPQWLLDRLQVAYPQDWERICLANLQRPPMVLRVNGLKIDRASYLQRLKRDGIAGNPHPQVSTAIELETAMEVREIPGFSSGWVSVQDAAAQLAAPLLDCQGGMRVLDACAAPGGKTAHLLERAPDIDLVAVDQHPKRMARVRENLDRLDLKATLIEADVSNPKEWWSGEPFDRILLDAPCSATGVIRRHPDIKLLRRSGDIAELVEVQFQMLSSLWPLLSGGGILLYSTCSVLPDENRCVVERFLAQHPDCEIDGFDQPGRGNGQYGWQILPGELNMDGFYYARLRKTDL